MHHSSSDHLIVLDQFSRALAEAETLDDVTEVRSRAEAVRSWAKSAAESLEVQNRAAELKLRAERKAGRLLAQLKLHGGNRKSSGHDDRLKLADLGITQNQSKRWQKEAAIPDDAFEDYIRKSALLGDEITAAGLMRIAKRPAPHSTVLNPLNNHSPHGEQLPGGFCNLQADRGLREGGSPRMDEHSVSIRVADLVVEMRDHHGVLRQMLLPVCSGEQESLQPGQRRGIQYYLSEIERILDQLVPQQ